MRVLCNRCLPCQVFSEYFKELEEESIRDNFVIIYELLDELMDFGYPQTTDSKILQESVSHHPSQALYLSLMFFAVHIAIFYFFFLTFLDVELIFQLDVCVCLDTSHKRGTS